MTYPAIIWISFNVSVVLLLLLDVFVLSPRGKEIKMGHALGLMGFWVALALAFNAGIYFWLGQQKALEFLAGYLIEQSLSVDNLFVFLLIFNYFKITGVQRQNILSWGIIGAQIMRLIFILVGVALLTRFHWLIYIFGFFLVLCGLKLFFKDEKEEDLQDNPVVKGVQRFFRHASKVFIVLVIVQITDLVFAIDSIPAVLAITKDPFIAYTSNIFAVLGLRALFFIISGFMAMFHYLHYGLGLILVFVGVKMLSEHFWHIPIIVALGVIAFILAASIVASILLPIKKPKALT